MAEQYEETDLSTSMLTGAATGAVAGSVGGPVGTAVGAVIGAGVGLFQAQSAAADQEAAEKEREEALRRASFLKIMAERQTSSMSAVGRSLGPQGGSPTGSVSTGGAAPAVNTQTSAVGQGMQTSAGTF